LRNKELFDFFSQAGLVRDAKIITDRNTRRSKGIGYVEFDSAESVPKAIAMTGQKLLGVPVIVSASQAEKNYQAMQRAAGSATGPTRLYVGNFDSTITEDDLKLIFIHFGEIDDITLQKDPETKRSKGAAFIQYKKAESAKLALDKMNGFELSDRPLRVGLVNDRDSSSVGGNILDDHETGGLTLTAQSRMQLMANLSREPGMAPILQPPVAPILSRTILLKNMFDPDEETEPNWPEEIRMDVSEECSKFGQVLHCAVDKDSKGFVHLKFENVVAAQKAFAALNGRKFSGRQIAVEYIPEPRYNIMFPGSG